MIEISPLAVILEPLLIFLQQKRYLRIMPILQAHQTNTIGGFLQLFLRQFHFVGQFAGMLLGHTRAIGLVQGLQLLVLFYLPYLSSIHEKANCIAILWTVSPHSLGSCLFRGLWVTCLPHKGGASR